MKSIEISVSIIGKEDYILLKKVTASIDENGCLIIDTTENGYQLQILLDACRVDQLKKLITPLEYGKFS